MSPDNLLPMSPDHTLGETDVFWNGPDMGNTLSKDIGYTFEIGAGEPLVLANLELATGCERDCEGLVADGDAVLGFLICEAHQELAWRDVA